MKHVLASALSLSLLLAGTAVAAPQAATTAADAARATATAPAAAPAAAAQPRALTPEQARAARAARVEAGGHAPRMHRGMPQHRGMDAHRHMGMAPRHGAGPRGFAPRGERMRLGAPLAETRQGVVVSQPRKHGLAKAPRGQEWRKVGQRYVRVTSGTNVVNEIVINGL